MNRSLVAAVALVLLSTAALGADWEKYVAADRSFSFHYPSGWKATSGEGYVAVDSASGDEQIIVAGVPYEAGKTPRELAEGMVAVFRQLAPDLTVTNWKQTAGDTAALEFAYTSEGKSFRGDATVVRMSGSASWFSFSAPASSYSPAHALEVLGRVMSSATQRDGSKAPTGADPEQIRRNSQAFLFVLEFALGAPLTAGQEKLIVGELKAGWAGRSAEELSKYDEYPKVVEALLSAKQGDLEDIRETLEEAVREVLRSEGAADPAMKTIEAQLDRRGKVVADGKPPLTEMAAAAYSEMIAYSELLHKQREASPSDISGQTVSRIRGQLVKAWKKMAAKERDAVAGTPGLWVRTRKLLEYGSAEERAGVRDELRKITASYATPKPVKTSGKTGGAPMGSAAHWAMMQIQQQTFNTYMTSRGFSGWTYTGKMW